jgi:hypothetical protein
MGGSSEEKHCTLHVCFHDQSQAKPGCVAAIATDLTEIKISLATAA